MCTDNVSKSGSDPNARRLEVTEGQRKLLDAWFDASREDAPEALAEIIREHEDRPQEQADLLGYAQIMLLLNEFWEHEKRRPES